jgi:hypothetical protein
MIRLSEGDNVRKQRSPEQAGCHRYRQAIEVTIDDPGQRRW